MGTFLIIIGILIFILAFGSPFFFTGNIAIFVSMTIGTIGFVSIFFGVVFFITGKSYRPAVFYENGIEIYQSNTKEFEFFPYGSFTDFFRRMTVLDKKHYLMISKDQKKQEIFIPDGIPEVEIYFRKIKERIGNEDFDF